MSYYSSNLVQRESQKFIIIQKNHVNRFLSSIVINGLQIMILLFISLNIVIIWESYFMWFARRKDALSQATFLPATLFIWQIFFKDLIFIYYNDEHTYWYSFHVEKTWLWMVPIRWWFLRTIRKSACGDNLGLSFQILIAYKVLENNGLEFYIPREKNIFVIFSDFRIICSESIRMSKKPTTPN